MKKLLMASATLFLFSTSIMLFQISCSKDANAGTTISNGIASKIIYLGKTTGSQAKIYIKNADGTGATTTLSPTLPNGYLIETGDDTDVNSDGTYVYFSGVKTNSSGVGFTNAIFRCDLNGSNPIQLTTESDVIGFNSIF